MIIRIVKMTFNPERVNNFKAAFDNRKELIAGFEGCKGVKLLNDIAAPNVFFTYSIWETEAALEKYRQSALFNSTWNEVKQMFAGKPEAWSLTEL